VIQHRRAQLVQTLERQLHLGLHTRCTSHLAAGRAISHGGQQSSLAHARLAVHDKRPAPARAHHVEKSVEAAHSFASAPQGWVCAVPSGSPSQAPLHDTSRFRALPSPFLACQWRMRPTPACPTPRRGNNIIASPLLATVGDLAGLPEAFVLVDECDVLGYEGVAYARKLIAAGVRSTSVRYNGTLHYFMMLNPSTNRGGN
jgi:acetyl esterase/lipase